MKFTNKVKSYPYTLLFCQVIVFSFAVAYGLTWLIPDTIPFAQERAIDRQQLFKNYRILKSFLGNDSAEISEEPTAADADHPLLTATENLKRAQQLFEGKKYQASSLILAALPGRFPHIAAKRATLLLKNLYATGKHRDFVAYFDQHPSASLETKTLLLDCLLKSRLQERAHSEFNALFSRQRLQPLFQRLPRSEVLALLKRLNEEDWFAKFSFLLNNRDGVEFRRELPYSGFRDLNRLFQAEFAYLNRNFGQVRQLLQKRMQENYRPYAASILVKIAVREDPAGDIAIQLQNVNKNTTVYPRLMFDLAQILGGKREYAKALPFYEQYLQLSRERDEDYWKTVWLLAWIHYRQDEKKQALDFFRQGSRSPYMSYRIASRYWLNKLENRKQEEFGRYPFSYYAVRVLQDKNLFKNLNQGFVAAIDDPPGPFFMEVIEALKILVKYSLWDDCLETIHWAKSDSRLSSSDLNLLKIIESLLYYQQNRFFLAFTKFRSNFRFYESVHLPNFLSGIFFPRQYENLISAYSKEQEVDPGLVLALIREESFFRSDARSPANAYGLMQLLHGTAREIANGSNLKVKAKDLYDPEINIRLGLQYLKTLLDRYDGRLYLALAAYNAGPHRVNQWLQDFPDAAEEEFIEMIPFSETRNYVKNILRNYFFYRYYYANGKP
ncbi:MAG: lytic transglycosylase domain-containing protein [Acidobacteria bacterium]|nr:lytic transglycosylase domain-containing protein [Acidobacteriota bacterium]MBU4307507.1 lytic transglycosylase domain-containing protein [Acidobacteriota bacterium]MCG2810890.1 lytic transglycosylase domain-containing protein [Candidatus Aminicenantes bacterium]